MFGLSNAQAAATLAAVLVGYNIILPSGERLLNEDVLNGTILLILVTCVVSSLITDVAARRLALQDGNINLDCLGLSRYGGRFGQHGFIDAERQVGCADECHQRRVG